VAVDATETVLPIRAPRPGELAFAWRLLTAVTWIMVITALASVWNVSDQLGHSTWWLGARGEPQPRLVQLLPFVPAVLMVLGAINRIRYLAWSGIAASASVMAVGFADLGRVRNLAFVEISIGVAAALVSAASLIGTYRRPAPSVDAG
jgi:hypothetical protein